MERRRRYRVRLADQEPVQVTLGVPGWPAVAARLRDASAHGVGLEIPAELPLSLAVGGEVDLTVWLLRDHRAVDVDAEIVDQLRINGVRHVGLRFADPAVAERELGREFGAIFNRRGAPRVAVEPSIPVTMTPLSAREDATARARLQDLSESGMAVALPEDQAALLGRYRRFEIAMALADEPLRVRARMRHRRMRDGHVTCGLEIEPGPGGDADAVRATLREFVTARQ